MYLNIYYFFNEYNMEYVLYPTLLHPNEKFAI